ncbi:MAG: DUF305 domain-containing protein [Nocardioidaceae bacterium]|nr:DUF305 domain-containing protein [Nocardioidaceae bacterium]
MQSHVRRRLSALVLVPLLALLVACASDDSTPSSSSSSSDADAHNDMDVSFATDMISHHAQAIEMADMAISMGADAAVVELANQIKDAQQPEIDTMSGWLEAWDEPVPDTSMGSMSGMDHGDMGGGMPGMMTAEDMQSLDDASGPEFDQLWLEMMTEHHEGAVEMAKTEVQDGENTDAKALAQTIIDAQEAEISTMEDLLGGSK